MKYLKLISIILLVNCTVMISCNDDFLNTSPLDKIAESDVFKDPVLTESVINGIYRNIQMSIEKYMKCIYVDEAQRRDNAQALNFNKCLITQDVIPFWYHETWNSLYKQIRKCNVTIEGLESADFEGKDRMMGEARFLRAYTYHQLIRLYGGVPLITTAYGINDEFEVPRDKFEDCVKFIVDECDASANLLPLSYTGDNIGRATKGAALALKARVLLYAASDLYNTTVFPGYSNPELIGYTGGSQATRWEAAKSAAKAVMDLGIYSLYKPNPSPDEDIVLNYTEIFLNKYNPDEDIWNRFETLLTMTNNRNLARINGMNGWGGQANNTPTGNHVDDYEMINGTKFDWNNPEHAAFPYKNRDPRFYANIHHEGQQWVPRPDYSKDIDPYGIIQLGYFEKWDANQNKVVIVPGIDSRNSPFEPWNAGQTSYLMRKFTDPAYYPPTSTNWQEVSWRYFRYAEILLNYAEACIELGQDAEARTYINMIRRRVGMPDITESGEALMVRYRNERQIELAFEEHRFYDVRRWVIAPEAYTTTYRVNVIYKIQDDHTTSTVPTITPDVLEQRAWINKAYFFPIMRTEMNRNSQLIQNPDY